MRGSHSNPCCTLFACNEHTLWVRLPHSVAFSSEHKLKRKFKLLMGAICRSLLQTGQHMATVAFCALCLTASPALLADTLITNARIIDGTGSGAAVGSVRLTDDRIAAVGEVTPNESDDVIDAGGLVLAPGFIDTHSHSDRLILTERDALVKIAQGITTAVVGQDGDAPHPLADFFGALEATPSKFNIAAYAGHNTLRDEVLLEVRQGRGAAAVHASIRLRERSAASLRPRDRLLVGRRRARAEHVAGRRADADHGGEHV